MPTNNLTTQQIENVQIDYGLVYINYGEAGQQKLGPTKGGAEFTASKNIREIEYDGRLGKSKGMQVIDEINAMLKFSLMDTSLEMLDLALPQASYDVGAGTITNGVGGVIAASKYLTNIVMFAKVVGGGYKKITLYNAMNEADFVLAAGPKSEGVVPLEVYAHWDPEDQDDLYQIEDVANISSDTTPPTVTTTPVDAAVDVVVTANLTAEFSEAVRSGDITTNNFILVKASDGFIVAGALSYNSGTLIATFNPTSSLDAATAYIWLISGVRDTVGNVMVPVAVNFTTAA